MYPASSVAARRERQALETDHRVAAPIGEPMIAGDDGADFIARGMRARRFLRAAGGRDDELVGREDQLRADALARFRNRSSSRRVRRARSAVQRCGPESARR